MNRPWVGWLMSAVVIFLVGLHVLNQVEKHLFPIFLEEMARREQVRGMDR